MQDLSGRKCDVIGPEMEWEKRSLSAVKHMQASQELRLINCLIYTYSARYQRHKALAWTAMQHLIVRQSRAAALQGFEPLELAQHAGKRLLHFPTFDAALDEYFSKVQEPQLGWLSGLSAVCNE